MGDAWTTTDRPAPLAMAQEALAALAQLTAEASRQEYMAPQVQTAVRTQQEGLMSMAQATALVSIAESLADLRRLARLVIARKVAPVHDLEEYSADLAGLEDSGD